MEKSSKRGKIPQRDWPSIIKRYEAGETLASIARTYDCSPPAISYIVSRSRAQESIAEGTMMGIIGASESSTAKGNTIKIKVPEEQAGPNIVIATAEGMVAQTPIPVDDLNTGERQINTDELAPSSDPTQGVLVSEAGGTAERAQRDLLTGGSLVPAGAEGSEPRRTLHLSISHDRAQRSDLHQQPSPDGTESPSFDKGLGTSTTRPLEGSPEPSSRNPAHHAPPANGGSLRMTHEPRRAKDADAFIDQELRERVSSDITAFLAAFDAALTQDTLESRAGLRDATDRLLRAGARTRIQLERLEARVPLAPRDGQVPPTWRVR